MKFKTALATVVVSVAMVSTVVWGAESALASKQALIKRYYNAIHIDRMMGKMLGSMVPAMIDQIAKQNPALTPQMREAIVDSTQGAALDLLPKIESRIGAVMADKFSIEELQSVVEFHESPIGQKILEKNAELVSSVGPVIRDLMPDMQADMMRRLCAKIDCTGPKPPIVLPT